MRILLSTILFFHLSCYLAQGQTSVLSTYIFGGPHANHKNDPVFIDLSKGLELKYGKLLMGQEGWPAYLHCESLNLSVIVYDLSGLKGGHAPIPEGLGQSITIIPNLDILVLERKNISFIVNPGVGIGFNNNTYQNTPENRFISTIINNAFMVNFNLRYDVTDSSKVSLTMRAYHTSNGAVRTPNEGINLVNLGLGFSYYMP